MRRVDDFPPDVVRVLRERAGTRCSLCDRQTTGPHSKKSKVLNSGVAAHICAAQKNGPRFSVRQTSKFRRSAANGIWVCHSCSDIIDKDPAHYTAAVLRLAKNKHDRKIKAEHRGRPRADATAAVTRFVAEQRRVQQQQHAEEAAALQVRAEHQAWADAVINSLRLGPGNACRVPPEEEHHARWAIKRGLLSGMEWKSGLTVSLRQGSFSSGGDEDDDAP